MRRPDLSFWLGTWTGRLILVNALVFIALTVASGSLFVPDTEVLIRAGAKDPTRLAAGEWWRLVTPMFIHIGVLHFAVNSYILYAIGGQLERILGGFWFLVIYLAAGIVGNAASAAFTVNLSAGASGAIFGLLGAGFYIERSVGRRIRETTGQKPRFGAYAATVALNLAFGFIVPFIDNAAHLGGLVAGVMLTMAMVNLRPNRLQKPRKAVGVVLIVALVVGAGVCARLGTSPRYLRDRLHNAAVAASDLEDKIFYASRALEIDPGDAGLRLMRARLLFEANESKFALYDVREALRDPGLKPEIERLAAELEAAGKATDAWNVRRLLEHGALD